MQLLGIERAAVPVTVVAAEILAQEVKPLPLLDEFVMRLAKAHVRGAAEIAAFLGIDRNLIDTAVADRFREGALLFGPGLGQLTLTDRGRRLADDLESIKPVQKTVKVSFDRLTWSVTDYESRELITKTAALSDGRILLPAQHSTRIKTSDIPATAVNSILKQPSRRGKFDVLDVVDVTPSTHRYLPVDVLVYGDGDRGEIEAALVIDGDPSEKHDSVLSKLGGPERLGLTIETAGPHAPLPSHLEGERVSLGPGASIGENLPPVRGIRLFDHESALLSALEKATDRIVIATDMATKSVVDSSFLAKLDQRLRAQVQVDLALSRIDHEILSRFDPLSRRHRGKLRIHELNGRTCNTLLFDETWVVSDFPWLSFRGAERPLCDYSGSIVTLPDEVTREYLALLKLFKI
ncbi:MULTISPECIES: phospholipase D-like domain-containing protein [unclassified Nocardia]|uniref:hypothetical protein n=1 Tax=unclassified Nocardia TaxID=2637762 RepID=UPI0033ABD985